MAGLSTGPQRLAALLLTAFAAPASAQTAQTTQLNEILVTADRDQVPRTGTATVIGSDALTRRAATDMANIARYEPLISVPAAASGSGNIWDGAGNTGFNIRGIEGNRVSLDVDGVALPDAAPRPDGAANNAFGIGRDYFDPEMFREVRIGSGTTPVGAGTPGLGGNVAFVTRSPEDYLGDGKHSYAEYKFGYLSSNGGRMHALTGAAGGGALKALAVLVHRDGRQTDSKGTAAVNPDDWRSDALLGKFNWALAPGHKLGLTIDAFKAGHDRVYANKLGASYPEGALQHSSTRRTRVSLEHGYTGRHALFDTLHTRVYAQDAEVEDRTHAAYVTGGRPYVRDIETGFYNKSRGLTSDATRQLGAATLLAYGVAFEDMESRRPWREVRTVLPGGAQQVTQKNRMADMDTRKLAAYLRGEFGFTLAGRNAIVTPGLRAEHRKLGPKNLESYLIAVPAAARELVEESDTFLTPSLAVSVDLSPGFSAYGQYSRGTRLPTAAERTGTFDSFSYTGAGNGYAVLGNARLEKESSDAFELGLKGAPAQGVQLSASLFHTSYDNFIEYAAQPADPVNYPTITFGLYRPENLGQAKIWGGEVSARFDLGHWSAPLNGASVALAAGASRGSATNAKTGKRGALASVLPYKASATFAWDDPAKRGGAALSAVHVRAKQAEADVIAGGTASYFAVPCHTLADLTAYWNLGRHASVTAGVYNLGDRKYWDYAASRGLPAGATAIALADIERQAQPGRNYAVTFKLMY